MNGFLRSVSDPEEENDEWNQAWIEKKERRLKAEIEVELELKLKDEDQDGLILLIII